MTKAELEVKLEALQKLLDEQNASANAYRDQIQGLKKQLADLNKPRLTPLQFDELHEAIEEAVGQFDFDDCDQYDTDFHIDYDNRIAIESMSFHNADELAREIYSSVSELFVEETAPENEISTQEHLNQD